MNTVPFPNNLPVPFNKETEKATQFLPPEIDHKDVNAEIEKCVVCIEMDTSVSVAERGGGTECAKEKGSPSWCCVEARVQPGVTESKTEKKNT